MIPEQARPLREVPILSFDENILLANTIIATRANLEADLYIYPDDDPLCQYYKTLFAKALGDKADSYNLIVYSGEPNSMAAPDGTIYVADSLAAFAETEEAVQFVLAFHERKHIDAGHARRTFGTRRGNLAEQIGTLRFDEMEADLAPTNEMIEAGINPLAARQFMDKLRGISLGGDIVHGSPAERVINMASVEYFRDIEILDQPLTPVDRVASFVSRRSSQHDMLIQACRAIDSNLLARAIMGTTTEQAPYFLLDLLKNRGKTAQIASPSARQWVEVQDRGITALTRKTWEGFVGKLEVLDQIGLSDPQKKLLFHAYLELGFSINVGRDSSSLFESDHKSTFSNGAFSLEHQMYIESDEILEIFDPVIFASLDIVTQNNPTTFAVKLLSKAIESGLFESDEGEFERNQLLEFTSKLISRVAALYETRGTSDTSHEGIVRNLFFGLSRDIEKVLVDTYSDNLNFNQLLRNDILKNYENVLPDENSELYLIQILEVITKMHGRIISETSSHADISIKSRIEVIEEAIQKRKGSRLAREHSKLQRLDNEARKLFTGIFKEIIDNHGMDFFYDLLVRLRLQMDVDDSIVDIYLYDGLLLPLQSAICRSIDESIALKELSDLQRRLFQVKCDSILHAYASQDTLVDTVIENFHKIAETADDFYQLYLSLTGKEIIHKGERIVVYPRMTQLEVSNNFKKELFSFLKRRLNEYPDLGEMKEDLEVVLNSIKISYTSYGIRDRDSDRRAVRDVSHSEYLGEVFQSIDFQLDDPVHLVILLYLSSFVDDNALGARLEKTALHKITETFDFERGITFLEQQFQRGRFGGLGVISNFIDRKAFSHEQIARARDVVFSTLSYKPQLMEMFGAMVGAEEFLERFLSQNKVDLLKGLIGNGHDDFAIKSHLYHVWLEIEEDSGVALPITMDDALTRMYRSDEIIRHILMRNLLVGQGGILMDKKKHMLRECMDFFIESRIHATSSQELDMLGVMKQVMYEIPNHATYDLLFFALAPFLVEHILTEPLVKVDWKTVIKWEEQMKQLSSYSLLHDVDFDIDALYKERIRGGWKSLHDLLSKNNIQKFVVSGRVDTSILLEFTSDDDEMKRRLKQFRDTEQKAAHSPARAIYEPIIENLIGGQVNSPQSQQMTVAKAIHGLLHHLKAPGDRFEQIATQFFDLSAEMEAVFNLSYDQQPGQPKIVAHDTLLRERPEVEHEYTGLDDRLGGGSLMTVFSTQKVDDGSRRVFKVMNPNALRHSNISCDVLEATFEALAKTDPQYDYAITLAQMIRRWIAADINFTGFIEQDKVFKETHEGFAGNTSYSVHVPTSYPPEKKKSVIEDQVEGTNLTKLATIAENGHDVKEVIQLLVRSLMNQITSRTVLSDINPGNARVMDTRQVALLDRNYYLTLTEPDLEFFTSLLNAMDEPHDVVKSIERYFDQLGRPLGQEQSQSLLTILGTSFSETTDVTRRILKVVVALNKQKLSLPDHISLVIKDIYYADSLSRKVGFANIFEAYFGQTTS